jgi:hypothetical protein
MSIMAVAKFERLFRSAAGLDVGKDDLRRFSDFLDGEIRDLLVRGQAVAKANGRDVLEPWDIPVTKGLQECMHVYGKMEGDLELKPILEQLTARPPLDVTYSDAVETALPAIAGGLTVAVARTMKVLDPELKTPSSDHWDRASQLFDLLL